MDNYIVIISITVMILIFVLDLILVGIIKSRKIDFKNDYLNFHKQYGFVTLTLIKTILALSVIAGVTGSSIATGAYLVIIMIYARFVLGLAVGLVKYRGEFPK